MCKACRDVPVPLDERRQPGHIAPLGLHVHVCDSCHELRACYSSDCVRDVRCHHAGPPWVCAPCSDQQKQAQERAA